MDIEQSPGPVWGLRESCVEIQHECHKVNPQRIKGRALTKVQKLVKPCCPFMDPWSVRPASLASVQLSNSSLPVWTKVRCWWKSAWSVVMCLYMSLLILLSILFSRDWVCYELTVALSAQAVIPAEPRSSPRGGTKPSFLQKYPICFPVYLPKQAAPCPPTLDLRGGLPGWLLTLGTVWKMS